MCSTHPAGHGSKFRLEDFFAGRSTAWGLFQDRSGKIRRRFQIEALGVWKLGTLTLTEDFSYDDGQTERRVWHIKKTGDDRYEGVANDVIGAAQGTISGNALHWTYRFALKVGRRSITVRFDDWLLRLDDDLLINRAQVSKFGIRIGDVTCVFRKLPATPAEVVTLERVAADS